MTAKQANPITKFYLPVHDRSPCMDTDGVDVVLLRPRRPLTKGTASFGHMAIYRMPSGEVIKGAADDMLIEGVVGKRVTSGVAFGLHVARHDLPGYARCQVKQTYEALYATAKPSWNLSIKPYPCRQYVNTKCLEGMSKVMIKVLNIEELEAEFDVFLKLWPAHMPIF